MDKKNFLSSGQDLGLNLDVMKATKKKNVHNCNLGLKA